MMPKEAKVAVLMGSLSDLKIMERGIQCLKTWGLEPEVKILSAHRTPQEMQDYALKAEERGLKVLIAGAGGSAHLPGMLASLTSLPVIGVPISLKHLQGIDSFLSIAQMPKGVPVATVAIDNSFNAALLALRILAVHDPLLNKKLKAFHEEQKTKSLESGKTLKELLLSPHKNQAGQKQRFSNKWSSKKTASKSQAHNKWSSKKPSHKSQSRKNQAINKPARHRPFKKNLNKPDQALKKSGHNQSYQKKSAFNRSSPHNKKPGTKPPFKTRSRKALPAKRPFKNKTGQKPR